MCSGVPFLIINTAEPVIAVNCPLLAVRLTLARLTVTFNKFLLNTLAGTPDLKLTFALSQVNFCLLLVGFTCEKAHYRGSQRREKSA